MDTIILFRQKVSNTLIDRKILMRSSVKFNNVNTVFSKSLKNRINDYFIENSKKKTGGGQLKIKAGILLFSLVVFYVLLVFVRPHWLISVPLSILFGVNLALIGFNVMHDAGHDTFSSNKKVNSLFSYSLNLLGGNIYLWKLKHNIAHHTYTNIEGEDFDIEVKFMRLHEEQQHKGYHRFQQYYFILLYGISYLAWVFYQDFEKYFRMRLSKNSEPFKLPLKEKMIFWISKIINILILVVIPVYFVGWVAALVGLILAGMACGLCLAVVFQLAHVVTETEFTTTSVENSKIENEWMIHQLSSTANFATKNKALTWLLGGLNFQVEHHLFPRISHIHYPALNKIVKKTCQEFGVGYNEFSSFGKAFQSHLSVIQSMSLAAR
jgi:linoleoyl-CoA desaturase